MFEELESLSRDPPNLLRNSMTQRRLIGEKLRNSHLLPFKSIIFLPFYDFRIKSFNIQPRRKDISEILKSIDEVKTKKHRDDKNEKLVHQSALKIREHQSDSNSTRDLNSIRVVARHLRQTTNR